MKISLRKASVVQQNIQQLLKSVEVATTVKFNEFEETADVLAKATEALYAADNRRAQLLAALYAVRKLVARANVETEISDRLASCAFIDKRLSQLAPLTEKTALQEPAAVVAGKLDKIRNDKGESRRSIYGYDDTVSSGILLATQIEGFQSEVLELKKSKQKLNDEILELNVRTEIEIPEDIEEILLKEHLV